MPGSPSTTNSDHIRGAGATARRQCKPSLTPSHSPGRNRWPPDVGQTQPFRHQTGQLSDQVSASTPDLLVQPFQHIGRFEVLMVLPRQPVKGQRLVDVLFDPAGEL